MKQIDDPTGGYRAIVQRIHDGRAIVAMAAAGCGSCGQGAGCHIGRMAAGRRATMLEPQAEAGACLGDGVRAVLSAGGVNRSALLGHFFPALATLVGAGCGAALGGSHLATAAGAALGMLAALAAMRMLRLRVPAPRPVPLHDSTFHTLPTSSQENSHER